MKEFLKQYCKIIAYSLMGLIFAFASFFLIVNLYHQSEISRTYAISFTTDAAMQKYQGALTNIQQYLNDFNVNRYQGTLTSFQAMAADQKLKDCSQILQNETIQEIQKKEELTIIDVYYLREVFENEVLGKCVIGDLNWFAEATRNHIENDYLKQNETMLTLYLEGLRSETAYLKKDLLNNSSFYFNTSLVSSTLRHNVKDGYYDVMASYNKVASVVEELSRWFYDETKGARA